MALVVQDVEKAAKTGFIAALTVSGITDANVRAFWHDDASTVTEEDRAYPMVMLETSPSTNLGANSRGTANNSNHTVPMTVTIATHIDSDAKRATLSEIYDSIRTAINSRDFSADFTTISSNLVFDALIVVGGTVGVGGTSDNASYVTIDLHWHVCGSP